MRRSRELRCPEVETDIAGVGSKPETADESYVMWAGARGDAGPGGALTP